MLTAPKEKEELIMYMAAAKKAISTVLMTERDGKQMPIYFVIRALQDPEVNYTPMEKLILALTTSVKGQIADFIVERPEDDSSDTPMEDKEELPDPWVLFTDGSSCVNGFRAGLIITNPEGMEFTYALRKKSIDKKEVLVVVEEEGRTWLTPIYEYLTEEILPEEKRKARAIRCKAGRYAVTNGILYKKSFLGPWLRCVGQLQENYVLREIHEGSCSMHAGLRSVVAKALRSGYYWPTMHIDARNLIRECSSCQGPGKVKFLIVAIDYSTKWIEAKPVATITGAQVKKFVCDNIVCRFGLIGEIISDNGKQFRDNPFIDWCEKLCIRQCLTSVKHPQANGLVERANRSLGEGIKARLDERSKKLAGRDITLEIGMPTLGTVEVDMIKNDEALGVNLDLLEEKRKQAAIQEEKSKAKMDKYYNVSAA
ncbi:reverse transcriptase domain-containing protein [Tanacetum coccineum]